MTQQKKKGPYYNAPAVYQTMLAITKMPLEISAAEGMVLLVIAMHTGEKTWLSYSTIAREAHMDRSTAFRLVEKLKEKKLIEVPGRHSSRANYYKLTVLMYAKCDVGDLHTSQNETSRIGDLPILEVANCDSDIGNLRHEVITENQNKEVEQPIRTEAGEPDRSSVPSSPVQEQKKPEYVPPMPQLVRSDGRPVGSPPAPRRTSGPVPVQQKPAAPPAPAVQHDPADVKLAQQYHLHLGLSRRWESKVASTWPRLFSAMRLEHSAEDLRGAIEWAFNISAFWPKHLDRVSGDPVEYFQSKIDTIMTQYRREAQAERNAQKTAAAKPGATTSRTPEQADNLTKFKKQAERFTVKL